MANINALYKIRGILPNTRVFLIAAKSITWLLNTGFHVIHIPDNLRKHQEWCALIPIGEPSIITSTGLKWNLGWYIYCITFFYLILLLKIEIRYGLQLIKFIFLKQLTQF